MLSNRRSFILVPVLALVVALVGCSDPAKKVGRAIGEVQVAVKALRTATHAGNTASPPVISDDKALAIYYICDKIDLAGIQADALTLQYSQLPAGSKPTLAAIVTPLIKAVDDALANGLVSVDPATKQKIETILQTIKTGLLTVQQIVGA